MPPIIHVHKPLPDQHAQADGPPLDISAVRFAIANARIVAEYATLAFTRYMELRHRNQDLISNTIFGLFSSISGPEIP